MDKPVADSHRDSQDHVTEAIEVITTERREWQVEKVARQEFRKRIRDMSESLEGTRPVARQGAAIRGGAGATSRGRRRRPTTDVDRMA